MSILAATDWAPDSGETEFGLTCAQCGKTVDSEGPPARNDGVPYQFRCPSCETRFATTADQLRQGADREGLSARHFAFETFDARILHHRKGNSPEEEARMDRQ